MELNKRLDLFLTERRLTTKTQMTQAGRELKFAKGRDAGVDLYGDFTKFLATYLNSLSNKEIIKYKIINKDKAIELVSRVASDHPNMQAVLDKLHVAPDLFVQRYWSKMNMKPAIQDAIAMLLKGEKSVSISTGKEVVEEEE